MTRYGVDEKTFLKNFALRQFNIQKGLKGSDALKAEDFDIFSVTPHPGHRYGYEIFTRTLSDHLRLQIHFNVTNRDALSMYKLQLSPPHYSGELGDEVWVATGEFDNAYVTYQGYRLEWLELDISQIPIILLKGIAPLRLVEGGFFILK